MTIRSSPLLLALILGTSLSLNVVGLDWGLPYIWKSDEKIDQAVVMVVNRTLNPDYFINPSLHIYTVAAAVATAKALYPEQNIQLFFRRISPMTAEDHPARPLQFLAMRLARGVSVVAAVLTVWLVFRIGRRQFGEPAGLVAAAFLAVTMGLVNMAHFATVESLLIVTLSLGAFDPVASTGGRRHYLSAGILVGLAVSTKYTAVLLVVPFLAAHLLHWGWRRAFERGAVTALAGGLAVIPPAFLVGTPYAAISWSRFWEEGIVFSWFTGAPAGTLINTAHSYEAYGRHLVNAEGWPLFLVCLQRRRGGARQRLAIGHRPEAGDRRPPGLDSGLLCVLRPEPSPRVALHPADCAVARGPWSPLDRRGGTRHSAQGGRTCLDRGGRAPGGV